MKIRFELKELKSIDADGKIRSQIGNCCIFFEGDAKTHNFLVKRMVHETWEEEKSLKFTLSDISSSLRLGTMGYVMNFEDNTCSIMAFRSRNEAHRFSEIIEKAKEDLNRLESMFSIRTEESSATQYFQFYGYLSQQQNMLQDFVRTSTYERAVLANTKDFQDKVVLDVGAGSGILSFFSAQAGASTVYAVEASSMAEQAKILVESNLLSDKIKVISGKVEEIQLPEMVDVIISEPMGYMLYNERMLETYLHAKKWLKPGGKMFPTLGDLHVAPFTDEALYIEQTTKASFWLQTHFHNIDLRPLHEAAMMEYFRQPIVDTFDIRICTAKSVRHTVNFLNAEESDLHKIEIPLEFIMLQSATVHGLAFWFDVAFAGSTQTVWLSTSPTEQLTHWYQVRCLLATPIFGKIDQKLVGKVLLEANTRQSYDVTIDLMVEGEPHTRSINCLDLKNPYFRYNGQAVAAPPGTNTISPSESYWSQLDAQTRQYAEGNSQMYDVTAWSNQNAGHGQVQVTNALNNTVNMVNGISLNGYVDVGCMENPNNVMAASMTNANANNARDAYCQRNRQRTGATIPTSTCAGQLIGGAVTPHMFNAHIQQPQQQQQIILVNDGTNYDTQEVIGEYISADDILTS